MRYLHLPQGIRVPINEVREFIVLSQAKGKDDESHANHKQQSQECAVESLLVDAVMGFYSSEKPQKDEHHQSHGQAQEGQGQEIPGRDPDELAYLDDKKNRGDRLDEFGLGEPEAEKIDSQRRTRNIGHAV